jgi:hypothetical protein
MKSADTGQNTLWQFSVKSSKEAVRLYFEPVQKVFGWLSDTGRASHQPQAGEQRLLETELHLDPPFNSIEDLKMRFRRLQLEVAINEWVAYTTTLTDIENLLHSAQNSEELQEKIRQMEIDLGLEKNLQPPAAKRSRGACGD